MRSLLVPSSFGYHFLGIFWLLCASYCPLQAAEPPSLSPAEIAFIKEINQCLERTHFEGNRDCLELLLFDTRATLRAQAQYCDESAYVQVHNPIWARKITKIEENPQYSTWNFTNIGNLAYLILNHKDQRLQLRLTVLLDGYKRWFRQQYPQKS